MRAHTSDHHRPGALHATPQDACQPRRTIMSMTHETAPMAPLQPAPDDLLKMAPRDTVVQVLARAVARVPDRVFIEVVDQRRTFRQIDRESNRLAHAFQAQGVAQGDRVVTILDTSVDVLVIWLALNKLGAIWVPINTAYTGEFLRHQVVDTGAQLLVCDAHYLDRVVDIAGALPQVKRMLVRNLVTAPSLSIEVCAFDVHRGSDESPLPEVVTPESLSMLVYTSGTTGPSKGCALSHNYVCMQGYQERRMVPMGPDDIVWTCLPIFHLAALCAIMGAMVGGLRCSLSPKFSVTSFWHEVEAAGATHALLMATIFPLVANAPDNDAMQRCRGQLRMIWGQPITPPVRKIWEERFGVAHVYNYAYGQTEVNRTSFALPGDNPPPGCAGRPTAEYEVCILDDQDLPVPEGQVGQIAVRPRGPNLMFEGYWNQPEQTARAWRNLWMHTGDLGRMQDGYLYFVDRAKDFLRCRGENVSSFEVERAFLGHPAIAEVAVHAVGLQDAEDDIKVTIVLREGSQADLHQLCHWAIEQLPHFAVPRYFEVRASLWKNPIGRVLKYRLREEGVTPNTWDRVSAGIDVRRRRV